MARRIRLCMVSPLYHPALGGVGRQAIALSEYLHSAGVDVVVMCRKFVGLPPWKQKDSLPVIQVPSLGPRKFDLEAKSLANLLISLSYCLSLLVTLIRFRNRFDIVHFHGTSLHLLVTALPLKLMGKKIIAKVTAAKLGIEAGSFRGKYLFFGDLFVRILKNVDVFIAITEEIRQSLISEGYLPERIFKTSNFILKDEFRPVDNSATKEKLRSKIGVPPGKFMLTFSGRLVERKRVDVLLEAVRLARNNREDFVVYILGTGELMDQLAARSEELGIGREVVFMGNVMNILEYLQATDLYLITSEREGMPNSLLEAMACRLPVIGTRIGGIVDLIEDRKNGILVEPGDATALAGAISNMLSDPGLRQKFADEAFRTIEEGYSIETVALRYVSLYRKMLEAK